MKILKLRLVCVLVERITMTGLRYIFLHCLKQYPKSGLDSYSLLRAAGKRRIAWEIVLERNFPGEKIVAK